MRLLFIISLFLISSFGFGQVVDSLVLGPELFMSIVRQNHPVNQQANLQLEKGDATLLKAKGGLDPKLGTAIDQKYFDNKQYYSLIDAGVKIPTWPGLEIKAGYSQSAGTFLNPENTLPSSGLFYGGITVPIGQGLFVDANRTNIRQARVYQEATQSERDVMLNALLYEAAYAYWNWFVSFHQLRVYEEALVLAEDRFRAVKEYVKFGDKPSIDTLEAYIQVQSRQIDYQNGLLNYKQRTLELENYIWEESGSARLNRDAIPIALEEVNAIEIQSQMIYQAIDSSMVKHPYLQLLGFEIEQLEIEQRWKKEQLKPTLDIHYQPLLETGFGAESIAFNPANYKWGLTFSMPIFLRKERGALTLGNIKILETNQKLRNLNQQLLNKARFAWESWDNLQGQLLIFEQNVQNYKLLLEGERALYEQGESSLFLINSRESKWVNARIKLVETFGKTQMAVFAYQYALGQLN